MIKKLPHNLGSDLFPLARGALKCFILILLALAPPAFSQDPSAPENEVSRDPAPATRNLDDILAPEHRLCGMLSGGEGESVDGRAYQLVAESSQRFTLTGPAYIEEHFAKLLARYHEGLFICVPGDPHTDSDVVPVLWIEMFAYMDPGASGVSVVSK